MCGIAGILNTFSGPSPSESKLSAMIGALQHRGPDGFGFYTDDVIGLAHARLSIIDLEGGWQPIHNEEKTVWVVFNGEIFNYIELRQTLEQGGHSFYTHSDTEVIVHLYEQHGEEFVQHLNGQFAIALWDKTKKRLILARDRTGIRPLFYTKVDGQLLFASEIKSLFSYPGVTRRLNVQALAEIFTFWSALPPATAFDGVSTLPPGHLMTVEDGVIRITFYWDWTFPEQRPDESKSIEEYTDELRELLIDSV